MTTTKTITIGLVDQDPQTGKNLQQYLNQQTRFKLTIYVDSSEQLNNRLPYLTAPEIILISTTLFNNNDHNIIRQIKQNNPQTQVLLLSKTPDEDCIFSGLNAGADGYLLKSTPMTQIKQAIIELSQGGTPLSPCIARIVIKRLCPGQNNLLPPLTPRERQIVNCLLQGLSYKQVATNLTIGIETVRHHIKNIYGKWQVNSKARLIALVNGQNGEVFS